VAAFVVPSKREFGNVKLFRYILQILAADNRGVDLRALRVLTDCARSRHQVSFLTRRSAATMAATIAPTVAQAKNSAMFTTIIILHLHVKSSRAAQPPAREIRWLSRRSAVPPGVLWRMPPTARPGFYW